MDGTNALLTTDSPPLTDLHPCFIAAILRDCARLDQAPPEGHDELQQVDWQCTAVYEAYKRTVLSRGSTLAELQPTIAAFAAAVLRVCQSLGGALGKLLMQRAYAAAEQVHSQLQHLHRGQQLLEVTWKTLGLQPPHMQAHQQHLQVHNYSWQMTVQQLGARDSTNRPALG